MEMNAEDGSTVVTVVIEVKVAWKGKHEA